MTDRFYDDLGAGRFAATHATAGPWDPALQHAGPPAALLGRALEGLGRDDTVLARITFDILGPVPVGEVAVRAAVVRPGRSVELLEAELEAAGRTAVTARAWRVARRGAPAVGAAPAPPMPARDAPAMTGFGYADAIEMRFAAGSFDVPGPATVWTRMRVPLVAGEEPTGLQRVLAVADSGNGVSAVLPFREWLFINTELTVHLLREPHGEWICLDAATEIAEDGAGLARSTLSDAGGVVARGAQSLYVAPR